MLNLVKSKVCGKCSESKDTSLFGSNAARKDGLQTYCRTCTKAYMAAKQYDKARWAECRGSERERNRAYRLKHAESIKSRDRAKASNRRKANPGAIRALNITRKHGQKLATPVWADMSAINAIYAQAKDLQATDGITRHVDHQIPLKHPLVCGLHVEANLKVMTATANMQKHNAFEVA